MSDTHENIHRITGIAILAAISIILQVVGNFVAFGPVSINLCLIPIALGAILYGPWGGAILGAVNGVMVLFAASTLAVFMPVSVFGTIFVCLLKCSIAGFVAGLLCKLFMKHNKVLAYCVAGASVVIINSGLFALGSMLFFMPILKEAGQDYANAYFYLFIVMIGWNFVFEFLSTTLFTPVLAKLSVFDRR